MGAGQIQVHGRAGPQVVPDLATIDLGDDAAFAQHRHHQRAGEMLVPARAVEADTLQARADVGARLAGLLRET